MQPKDHRKQIYNNSLISQSNTFTNTSVFSGSSIQFHFPSHVNVTITVTSNGFFYQLKSMFFFAEEEGSSFEDVEHNENILTLGLVGK